MTASTKHNNPGGGESQTWQPPLLFDAKDVMRECRVNRHAALELMYRAGAIKLGRSVRVMPEDLRAYLASQKGKAKGVINS
jgi:hypothetical protein